MTVEEENETFGPKVGIKLSLEQADLIIQRHLNLRATSFTHVNRGYNNRVYIVTTSNGQEYVIRLSGRFWTRYKTENEVAALIYIGKKCPAVPVPRVFGYCTDREQSGVGAEYILMERIKGDVLEHVWRGGKGIPLSDKKHLITQLTQIFASIQKVTFPQLGSFQLEEPIGNSFGLGINPQTDIQPENVVIGKGVEFEGGPFDTYRDYFKSTCETEIGFLKATPFVQKSEGYERRLERIEKFASAFGSLETVPEAIRDALENVPFVLTHGDYEPRNLIVDRETLTVTGILDFEFGGSYPIDEDWFTGFAFLHSDTSQSRVFNDNVVDGVDDVGVGHKQEVVEYFTEQMRSHGVASPDEIPGHIIRAELYYFKGLICPWWLREERDPIPETHYSDRESACRRVDSVLDKYGF